MHNITKWTEPPLVQVSFFGSEIKNIINGIFCLYLRNTSVHKYYYKSYNSLCEVRTLFSYTNIQVT